MGKGDVTPGGWVRALRARVGPGVGRKELVERDDGLGQGETRGALPAKDREAGAVSGLGRVAKHLYDALVHVDDGFDLRTKMPLYAR